MRRNSLVCSLPLLAVSPLQRTMFFNLLVSLLSIQISTAPALRCKKARVRILAGRANTVLVVCVAPSSSDSFETLNSLQFGQQAMSVKVQAKVNASVDLLSLEDELYYKLYELHQSQAFAEIDAWERVRPVYESQQAMRSKVDEELDR